MAAYYNEIDPYAAGWLRNLIAAGHIAPGVVDTRSIEDVQPIDLKDFTQCHFFAGIAAWSLALRQANWSDDRPVWTGSCPCQPFSTAGQGVGFADERHLWPYFHHLIKECNPSIVIGEQIASKDADPWIDLVQDDMEGLEYRFGAVAFPSAGVGAPHVRDRIYWVANSNSEQLYRIGTSGQEGWLESSDCGAIGSPKRTNGFWGCPEWLQCKDGKFRPIEAGTFPLAHGVAARVGRLRAYGNAINAEAARVFVQAIMECEA